MSRGVSNRGRRKVFNRAGISSAFSSQALSKIVEARKHKHEVNLQSKPRTLSQGRVTRLTFGRIGPLKKSVHFLSTSPSATIFPLSSIPTWALCWKLPGSGSVIWSMAGANDIVVRRRTDLLHERGPELGFTRAGKRWRFGGIYYQMGRGETKGGLTSRFSANHNGFIKLIRLIIIIEPEPKHPALHNQNTYS